jgi:hypothetical protein
MPTLGMNVKKEDLNIDKHIIINIIKSFDLWSSMKRQWYQTSSKKNLYGGLEGTLMGKKMYGLWVFVQDFK